ncbi:thioredoxin family protein [Neolewinella lacunae]|uniref:Thioredoxin family protein n=1 Tax=Neolewinella lacunae TaxID=1517758 RepID=A0A923PQR8_9BACT|nr:thioredoxin family protein [Neolewinella lacunae]MBC6995764.1 thioredoxin family protein [Neolewinella lacunae]MDN3636543.1 thioredoxin family protein [Neolewinella lacunae]
MQDLIHQALAAGRTYPAYRKYLTELLAAGKTTGPNQSELYLRIAHLNQARMDRLDKQARFVPELLETLATLQKKYIFLVLTEGWCGDAAQIVPILHHLELHSPNISLTLVLRDEHLALMDEFLTDGGRSIPKVIALDAETHAVLGNWGPRPAEAQRMSMAYKYQPAPKEDYETHHTALHTWYARDKTVSTQRELADFLRQLEAQ